eukprot:6179042-Pleurochrysis_carterae.AAC.4
MSVRQRHGVALRDHARDVHGPRHAYDRRFSASTYHSRSSVLDGGTSHGNSRRLLSSRTPRTGLGLG